MRILAIVALAVATTFPSVSVAADVDAESVVPGVATALERRIGIPIVELQRVDDDPAEFWYRAMQRLCDRTGDNWCDDDVHVLQDTTNVLGWSRRLSYEGDDGSTKEVCVVLPPKVGVAPGYVARALSGSSFGSEGIPSPSAARLWVWLSNVAGCGSEGNASRADAFATLATTLIRGDVGFVSRTAHSQSRFFSTYRNGPANHWATNVGERILLDHWKQQAASRLGTVCGVSVSASSSLETDRIPLDSSLPAGADCTSGEQNTFAPTGIVSDANLWIWTAGSSRDSNPTTGLPPAPYSPFATFGSVQEAVDYVWDTSARF